jgi:hypothetical protein
MHKVRSSCLAMKSYVHISELKGVGEIVGGGVQKPLEITGRIQFRTRYLSRTSARKCVKIKMAVLSGQS